ncbi:MAG: 50S ribosomal protein L30 [Aggregatilineales bacterium]
MADEARKVKVTLVRSPIHYKKNQKDTAFALGLRRMNASRVLVVSPMVQGMLDRISHMITVEEVEAEA